MALNREIWINTITENFYPDNSFMAKSIDDSAFVNNKTVHIPNAGKPARNQRRSRNVRTTNSPTTLMS